MKKHLQKLLLLVLVGGAAAMLPAQTSAKVTIYGLKGPSGVGMIRLFEAPPRAAGFEISVEALAQADLMAAKFISGEAKIGILPPNVAAKIASSGKKIQIAAITGTGMLSLLSADPSVRRIEDLKGKTVEVAGQGATPDYVFRKILLSKGINPDSDLRLGYALAYPEIAQALIAGRVSLALLPEPFATMARNGNSNIKLVGDIQDEWIRLHGSANNGGGANYPMTALVVDGAFAAANGGLVKAVLESLEASVKWVTANPAAAGALVEKHDLGLRAPVVAAAIPRSNYVFIPASAARPGIEALFRAFLEFAPASIGEALPKDDFYYIPK
ncbi:MAG: ABC transporter substrate-binding protein [Treponema sp.]|jgi:NitT/TauT family transport system substrate-binding protein|nr:ABC transporter substrate-binding protein [Treponema sp.]